MSIAPVLIGVFVRRIDFSPFYDEIAGCSLFVIAKPVHQLWLDVNLPFALR
ncbi:hypothetical protein N9B73_13685 [Verrucomicrobiales bacterium]|nr:hypothetical protein [Verrucomicrobiales bacterium]